ncbi:retinoic acid receptor responder protein 3-like isoform X2 [Perca flavescens]|uniref:retinoic acid receptor responder protein 3-like isoform X2 n=1 Tax=Perca flavescens TaxID=8167 RepID=UPI00106ED4FE|nr:retinoic acid receptor responder protein 3-like isoform X2 [Perca flavescens]
MAPTRFNAKPGDLIEIDRGIYQHWAIYIGGMQVVHLTTPNGDSSSSGSSLMVLDSLIGKVKRENIWEVVGNNSFKVNNLLDDKYQPRESYIIVKEACSMVIAAAEIGGAVLVGAGIVALGAALFASWFKDDNKEERREERREPRRQPRRHYNWQQ